MRNFIIIYFCVCFNAVQIYSKAAPGLPFQKCKAEDFKCIKDVTNEMIPIFTAGLPEYNVETLDPYHAKTINASIGNLLFVINDVTITGMKGCHAKKVERILEKSQIHLKMVCTAKLEGQYILKGSVLVVPLEGNGKILVDMREAVFDLLLDLGTKQGKDGKNHWDIKTYSYTFDLKAQSDVVFENLYDGNEVLGRAAKDLVKNNGNDIIKEIGGPVVKHMVSRVAKGCGNFFKAIPSEELSID